MPSYRMHTKPSLPFNGLIQRISLMGEPVLQRIIVFISARSGEGTSMVAREYARMLARETPQKILLMDAASVPEKTQALAIADALLGAGALSEAVSMAEEGMHRGWWMSHKTPHGMAGKLAQNAECWKTLTQAFDTVIIDAPPLDRSYDGILLAGKADKVILVVEAENTPEPVVRRLRDTLQSVGATIAGIVMNKRRYYIPHHVYRKL